MSRCSWLPGPALVGGPGMTILPLKRLRFSPPFSWQGHSPGSPRRLGSSVISTSAARRGRRAGMYDLMIRGATVVDGLGREPRRADVAVKDSRIAAIGEADSNAAEVIDAGGLSLIPRLIHIPNHYYAPVTSDPPP